MKLSISAILFLASLGVIAVLGWRNNKLNDKVGQLQEQIIFGDSQVVQLSKDLVAAKTTAELTSAQKDTLSEELAAIKQLNATLIASASVKLKPETVYRDKVSTVVVTTSHGRKASVKDSTDLGVLTAFIDVPADTALEIGFNYRFAPNPLNVDISLARTEKNTAFFLIKYTGGQTEVSYSYSKLPRVESRFSWYIQGGYYISEGVAAAIGSNFRVVGSWYLNTFAEQKFVQQPNSDNYDPLHLFVGVRKQF